ncbi:MAG: FAD-dependent oxidoreductase [Ruminococcaceae bacterium]|nr:FAD-dependent oxidoreductase [Oscillospiraceae bacterium]
MQKSLWSDTITLPKYRKMDGDLKTDVLVIGGGICGILCAYFLKKAGIDCILVEKQQIAQGTTCNTTGKITAQHGLIYDYIIQHFGKETAQKYYMANNTAIRYYEELCKNIDCDFKKITSYTYSMNRVEKIENEIKALHSLGHPSQFFTSLPLPFHIAGAIGVENQAQCHPLKLIAHLVENLNIYENTTVRQIMPHGVVCDEGKITAKKIIVATHFPFINKHGSYFLKLYQHRSYVIALEKAQNVNGMYIDEAEGGLSFRNNNDLLLLGGCGQRTGKKCGNWEELIKLKNQFYPNSKIQYKWATQDCMSLDKIPYIGPYSKRTPNLYVTTGFNKWGMTSSMVSAMILCDLVQGIKNDYADIFSPSRTILKPQLLVNGFETISNFISPTAKRCPHMGCALTWNKAEHSWDCSCHGSRFKEDGTLLNNPATKNADTIQK